MRTSLGPLLPAQIQRVQQGKVADVARELVDAAKAQDPSLDRGAVLAKVLDELYAQVGAQNDRGALAAKESGVLEAQKAASTQQARNVGTSALATRFATSTSSLTSTPATKPPLDAAMGGLLLSQLYARFPSLRVDLEPTRLAIAAQRTFGQPARVQALVDLLVNHKETFLAARAQALAMPSTSVQAPRRAVVSGLSNGGMVAIAVLAKSGYQVDAFEQRASYTRNIQYGGRQALLDQLASIDESLAQKFLAEVGRHVTRGSDHMLHGQRRVHEMPKPQAPDPTRVPETGEEMLAQASTVLMECKAFEKVLRTYVEALPNVTVHNDAMMVLDDSDGDGKFHVSHGTTGESLGQPDLVVVSEGSNSSTFRSLGVKSAATSPQQRYIAGTVGIDSGGIMAKHFYDHAVDGRTERTLTATMGNDGAGKTWVVAGVARDVVFSPDDVEPGTPEYAQAQKQMITEHFTRAAGLIMGNSPEEIAAAKVDGAVEGGAPAMFTLQQRLSETATVGQNVIGFGDVVGNNHFSVGGGMQVAVIAHGQRLKKLLFEADCGTSRTDALKDYNRGALEDTMAWGHRGLADFYPSHHWKDAQAAYLLAVESWRRGEVKEPLDAIKAMLGDGDVVVAPRAAAA